MWNGRKLRLQSLVADLLDSWMHQILSTSARTNGRCPFSFLVPLLFLGRASTAVQQQPNEVSSRPHRSHVIHLPHPGSPLTDGPLSLTPSHPCTGCKRTCSLSWQSCSIWKCNYTGILCLGRIACHFVRTRKNLARKCLGLVMKKTVKQKENVCLVSLFCGKGDASSYWLLLAVLKELRANFFECSN